MISFFLGFLAGIIVGAGTTYLLLRKKEIQNIINSYERRIQSLEQQHKNDIKSYEDQIRSMQREYQEKIKQAKTKSLATSRSVIKGHLAEQFAPFLPGFPYLPSDARFLGNPVDYIVFNGYTAIKDGQDDGENLEIIFVDIKTGRADLSEHQQKIAQAVQQGRVRFEVIRPAG